MTQAPYRASDPEIPSSERDPVPAQSAVVEPRWQTEGDMSATCPKCEAFKREVSDAVENWFVGPVPEQLSRFIIPASDPVAEAAREAIEAIWQHGTPSRDAVIAAVIKLARTIERDPGA